MLLISCNRAKQELDGNTVLCTDFGDFCNKLESNKIILAPFCGGIPCEENIKKLSARSVLLSYCRKFRYKFVYLVITA